ncbi:MAG: hypothetical protein EP348_07500 [Alphaproteobacteria bacterium]|nr:MAG: hypothetical protein EP348_07500 [Alphaproteobacteria bacterium]
MSMQADFERLHERGLRRRHRLDKEAALKKSAVEPRAGDLATRITNKRANARARAKFSLLHRSH